MIVIRGLAHSFYVGKKNSRQEIPVLKGIDLKINKGEIVAVIGKSGSGKSTLLNLLSGYIKPLQGEIVLNGTDVTALSEGDWATFRAENLGFIFQSFQLIPSMTAFQNIELPLVMKGINEADRGAIVKSMLAKVGLDDYAEHYPSELSGGQQQRVSVARALIVEPPIILADEPTGSLDQETEDELLSFVKQLNEEEGITFVLITHDEEVASVADRVIRLEDGSVVERLGKGAIR